MAKQGRKQAERSSDRRGGVTGSVEDLVGQLRDVAGKVAGGVGLPSPPGALSAAQVQAISRGVSAQRTQIAAVTQQLGVLDEQLAVLERLLDPLVEWSSTWADLEYAVQGLLPGRRTAQD